MKDKKTLTIIRILVSEIIMLLIMITLLFIVKPLHITNDYITNVISIVSICFINISSCCLWFFK